MDLAKLILDIQGVDCDGDTTIADVVYDSRKVTPGALFVAMPGMLVHGREFVTKAIAAGAAAVAFEGQGQYDGAINVRIPDAKEFLGIVAQRFFENPSNEMTIVGITGTNGKTTITYLIESILEAAGRQVGVIGTVNYRYKGKTYPAPNTTPLAVDLARLFRQMKDAGVDTVVMEVSSHALDQKRVLDVQFDAAVFTNLSRDHLDYHQDIEDYFETKKRFFTQYLPASKKKNKVACLNLDDARGVNIAADCNERVITFGQTEGADIRMANTRVDFSGVSGRLVHPLGTFDIHSPLMGDFSVSNILAATSVAIGIGITPDAIRTGIHNVKNVPGRLEKVGEAKFHVLVDYAHTPEALENVLDSLGHQVEGRILTVFGCGGDRDPGKRPLMGAAVAKRSHVSIVTSDNPRTEDPQTIIDQILPGMSAYALDDISPESLIDYDQKKGLIVEPDRDRAIKIAVKGARKGDIVLIAGKGHEDYQILGTTKFPFDDRVKAQEALDAILKEQENG